MEIFIAVIVGVMVAILAVIGVNLITLIRSNVTRIQHRIDHQISRSISLRDDITATREAMDFIKFLVGQVAVIRFQEYRDRLKDGRLGKTNLVAIRDLVETIAGEVYDAYNTEVFDISTLLVNKNFLDTYTIKTTEMIVKSIVNEAIETDLDLL